MNIIKLSAVLAFSLLTIQISAQDYLDYSSKWYTVSGDSYDKYYFIYKHQIIGDTSINDTSYYKVHTEYDLLNLNPNDIADTLNYFTEIEGRNVIREDAGKIYSRTENGLDYLLMDYNLDIGDEVFIDGLNWEIYEIDSIEIGNGFRKIFKTTHGAKIYEGIGSTNGLFDNLSFVGNHPANALLCYQVDGVSYNIHQGSLPFTLTLDSCGEVSYKEIITSTSNPIQLEELTIYPNPFTNQLNIELNTDLNKKANVNIYSLNGAPLFSQHRSVINAKLAFQFPELPSGIYLLQIQFENTVVNRKVIKL